MANCDKIFRQFNQTIRLTDERREILKSSREDLRNRINGGYDIVKVAENINHDLEFQSQGSFVMDTIINPCKIKDQYDIDDGLYFIGPLSRNGRPTTTSFHNWVKRSIEEGKSTNKYEKIEDKDTCVRVVYEGANGDFNYHVDIPIYYANDVNNPDLAHKKKSWILSNPIEFIIWFENLTKSGFRSEFILESKLYSSEYDSWLGDMRKNDHQLRRIVRYLKAWGDYKKQNMPPGIVMTVLAGNNYKPNDRDDMALKDTLVSIKHYLDNNGFICPRPTTPKGEDLFGGMTPEERGYFKKSLNDFVDCAILAVREPNQKKACHEWQKHLGDRLPCGLAKDEKDFVALTSDATKSDLWCK